MIPRLWNMPYEELLNKLNLYWLSQRMIQGELIEVFQFSRGFNNITTNCYVTTNLFFAFIHQIEYFIRV